MNNWDAHGGPKKPGVLCIGAQKAGTSWLHHQLSEHPQIWGNPLKELHYFDARHCPANLEWLPWHFRKTVEEIERSFSRRKKQMPGKLVKYLLNMTGKSMYTPEWYCEAFAPSPAGTLPLDTTPEYSTLPRAGVAEVASFLPDTKFIYIVRDPIERAISQLRMNLTRRKIFPEKPKGYLQYLCDAGLYEPGNYALHIPRWQAQFGRDRLLILPYGRIADDPAALMREIEIFLGIDEHSYPNLHQRFHESKKIKTFPEKGYNYLAARLSAQYKYLYKNFDKDFVAALGSNISNSAVRHDRQASRKLGWAEAPKPRKPLVIGIGAQKAGTSWLYSALSQHPGIWTSPMKEVHYFDHVFCPSHKAWTLEQYGHVESQIWKQNRDQHGLIPLPMAEYFSRIQAKKSFTERWYREIFAPAPSGVLPAEITPAYSGLPPEGVDHIAEYLPNTKFIYMIRDPVDRAISQLYMNLSRAGRTPESLSDWRHEIEKPVLTSRGDYLTYVPRWRAHFGPRKLLILPFGMIAASPHRLMTRIEKFLGLVPHRFVNLERPVFVNRSKLAIPDQIRTELADKLAPQYAFLREYFDAEFNASLR